MTDTISDVDPTPPRRTLLDRIPPSLRTPPVLVLAALVVVLLIAVVALAVSRSASGEDPAASACRAFAADQWETYEFIGGLRDQLAASRNEKLRLAGKMWANDDYPFIMFIEVMNQGCVEIGEPIPFPD